MQYIFRKIQSTKRVEVVYVTKILLALIIGDIISYFMPWEINTWLFITIVVVMAFHVSLGLQLQKGLHRLIGTLLGAALGLIGFYITSFSAFWDNIYLLVVSYLLLFQIVWFPSARYLGIFSCVTFLVVMTSHQPGGEGLMAMQRVVDIFVGIIIALFVAYAVFPISSYRWSQRLVYRNWLLLANWMDAVFCQSLRRFQGARSFEDYEVEVDNVLQESQSMLSALKYEGNHRRYNYLDRTLRHQRAVWRYINLVDIVCRDKLDQSHHIDWKPLLKQVGGELSAALITLSQGKVLENKKQSLIDQSVLEKLSFYQNNSDDPNVMHACATLVFVIERVEGLIRDSCKPLPP